MKTLSRIAMAIAALAASGASQAQPNPEFCADLRSVVAAAQEATPFASFPDWSRNGRPMLAFERCGTGRDYDHATHRFLCTAYAPERLPAPGVVDAGDHFDLLVSRIEDCLPSAVRLPDEPPEPDTQRRRRLHPWGRHSRDAQLDLGDLRIAITLTVTSRFTRLELEAYDFAARAAFLAQRAEEWRRLRTTPRQ